VPSLCRSGPHPAPVRSQACAMPAHHRFRPDDGKCATGIRKPPADPAQNQSVAGREGQPTLPRRSTMICCRSTRTSASSAVRHRNRSRTRLKISLMRSAIRPSVARFCAPRQPDSIYDSDTPDRQGARHGRGSDRRTYPALQLARGARATVGWVCGVGVLTEANKKPRRDGAKVDSRRNAP
jgi:hypothetical protein